VPGRETDQFVISHYYFLTRVEAYLGRPIPDGWDETCEQRYRAAYREHLQAAPGVIDALDRIAAPHVTVIDSMLDLPSALASIRA
jgi:phosphoglycolate phosphatase-like HAD superfamily hydrolase